jgi:phenylacetate-CoA ligase
MRALGLHPDDIRGVDDLAKLPVLDKRDVRQHLYFDILSENHDKDQVLRITTCGARGEPMVTFADRAQLELRFAAKLRAAEWTGYRFGDRAARLIDRDTRDWLRRSRRMILEAKLARRKLAWSIPSPSVLERLRSSEAVLLEGDSEVLELLARLAAATGRAPAIPAILAGGQDLSDGVRRQIETVFGARVFDTYETRELGLVAHECEARQGLHVVSDGYLVEVLVGDRAAAPYEVGDLVVTVLDGFCLPFLRYRTGDRAMLLPREPLCPCGRASPRIAAIEGRRRSALVGPRSAVPGTDVARLVRSYEHAIRRYQVVQDGVDRVRFRYAKAGRFSDRDLDQILATLRLILPDVRLEAETLPDDEIVRDAVVTSLFVDFDASGALVVRDGPPPPARVG